MHFLRLILLWWFCVHFVVFVWIFRTFFCTVVGVRVSSFYFIFSWSVCRHACAHNTNRVRNKSRVHFYFFHLSHSSVGYFLGDYYFSFCRLRPACAHTHTLFFYQMQPIHLFLDRSSAIQTKKCNKFPMHFWVNVCLLFCRASHPKRKFSLSTHNERTHQNRRAFSMSEKERATNERYNG